MIFAENGNLAEGIYVRIEYDALSHVEYTNQIEFGFCNAWGMTARNES